MQWQHYVGARGGGLGIGCNISLQFSAGKYLAPFCNPQNYDVDASAVYMIQSISGTSFLNSLHHPCHLYPLAHVVLYTYRYTSAILQHYRPTSLVLASLC